MAQEIQHYRQHGQWPAVPGLNRYGVDLHSSPATPPSLGDLERQVRTERPDLSPDRVNYWALMRDMDVKAGVPLRPITEGA